MWTGNLLAFFLLHLLALVSAKTHTVKVGQNGLKYSPNHLNAAPGDKINFHFYPGGHSVVEGSHTHACHDVGKHAFFSGYFDQSHGIAKKMYTITVKDKNPLYIYCSQQGHCQSGMVMIVNPKSSKEVEEYEKAAKKSSGSNSPKHPQGGKFSKTHGK